MNQSWRNKLCPICGQYTFDGVYCRNNACPSGGDIIDTTPDVFDTTADVSGTGSDRAPQPARQPSTLPQSSRVPYAARTEPKGPRVLSVTFGVITVLVSVLWLASGIGCAILSPGLQTTAGVELGLATTEGTVAIGCLNTLWAIYGIVAGATLAFRRGPTGKVFAAIFWTVSVVIICFAIGFVF